MPQIQGVTVQSLPAVAAGNTTQAFAQDRQGGGIVSEAHGVYFTANRSGAQFLATTAAAGVAIPISSSATALTFTLYNPLGSPTVTELLRLNVGVTALGFVVASLGLGIKSGLNAATIPLATTGGTIIAANAGGTSAPNTQMFSAATISAACTNFFWLPIEFPATTTITQGGYDFNGGLILQPGSFATLISTAAQTGSTVVSATFNEWPV